MNEIKFRGWHTKANKMFSPEEMGEDQLTLMPNGKGFINVSSINTKLSVLIIEMIPMQYTGLKDKNNKEIYEGDILKLIDIVGKVFYNSATASFDQEYEGGDNESLYSNIEADVPMEIIGNIYENPELFQNEPANQTH